MANNDTMLNFVVALQTKGMTDSVKSAVKMLDLLAKAGEKANQAFVGKGGGGSPPSGGGGGAAPKGGGGAKGLAGTAVTLGFLFNSLKGSGAAIWGAVKKFGLLAGGIGLAAGALGFLVKNWASNYKEMLKWRKAFGMTHDDFQNFQTSAVKASVQYGVSMQNVANLTAYMTQGLRRGTEEAADMAGKMAALAKRGIGTEEDLRDIQNVWSNTLKFTDAGFQKATMRARQLGRQYHMNTAELMSMIAANKDMLAVFEKNQGGAEDFLVNIEAARIAFTKTGGTAEGFGALLEKLGDPKGPMFAIWEQSGGNIKKVFETIASTVQDFDMRKDAAGLEEYMASWGIGAKDVRLFTMQVRDTVKEMDEVQASADIIKTKSLAELHKEEEKSRTNWEKLGDQMERLKSGAYGVAGAFGNWIARSEGVQKILMAVEELFNRLTLLLNGTPKKGSEADTISQSIEEKYTGVSGNLRGRGTTSLGMMWDKFRDFGMAPLRATGITSGQQGRFQQERVIREELAGVYGEGGKDWLAQHQRIKAANDARFANIPRGPSGVQTTTDPRLVRNGETQITVLQDLGHEMRRTRESIENLGRGNKGAGAAVGDAGKALPGRAH